MSDKRKSNLMGVKPTLDINPLTRDFKQPESVLKKTAKSGPSMGEIGAVVGLGTAAGYTSVKKSKDVTEKESKKPTRKGSPMKANPAGGKKKGMDQEERRKYFGVKKSSLGVESRSLGGEMKRGYGAARQKGMGLEDEGLGLEMSKGSDYIKDLL